MLNKKNKEAVVINFDEVEVSNWKSSHIDADIYEDGTSSLPGIGKKPKAGTYCFDCDLMPWTIYELGEKGDCVFEVYIELSDEDIQTLVDMMIWAWDNEWFEHSTSETVLTELLKKKSLQIYNRVQPLAHQQFISKYPNRKDVEGFGVYEIFPPDEIIEFAREQSEND